MGGAGGIFPQNFKLPPPPSVYSCDCTVVVIVLTCGLIASSPKQKFLDRTLTISCASIEYFIKTVSLYSFSSRGMIVPGGFGNRGVEGKILAARYCRERKIPYLGMCGWRGKEEGDIGDGWLF